MITQATGSLAQPWWLRPRDALGLGGRNIDLSLALNYNSRVWHKANNEMTFDIDRDWPAPGLSLGLGKIRRSVARQGFMTPTQESY